MEIEPIPENQEPETVVKRKKTKRGLVVKLAALVCACVLISGSAASWITTHRIHRFIIEERNKQITAGGTFLAIVLKNNMAAEDYNQVRAILSNYIRQHLEIGHALVLDNKGTVIYDSEGLTSGAAFASETLRPDMMYIDRAIEKSGYSFGRVILGASSSFMMEEERRKRVVELILTLSSGVRDSIITNDFANIKFFLEELLSDDPDILFCKVSDSKGNALFVESRDDFAYKQMLERDPGPGDMNIEKPILVNRITMPGRLRVLDAGSIVEDRRGNCLGFVRLGYSMRSLDESIRVARLEMLWLGLGFIGLGILLSVVAATRFTRPILKLVKAAERVGRGDLDTIVDIRTRNELEMLGNAFNDMISGLRERDFIMDTFSRYISKQVAEELLKHPELMDRIGMRRNVSIMFADIRGFTTIAEQFDPEQVFAQLNEFFSAMIDVIFKFGGTLDKFMGDAVMVVFGTPLPQSDHAERAVRAALDMSKKLSKLNEKWESEGKPPLEIGIGINTGDVLVGNVGDQRRMEYTVIGDHVNLASRLENLSKKLNKTIIISGYTQRKIGEKAEVVCLGEAEIKGKKLPVEVYEVVGMK